MTTMTMMKTLMTIMTMIMKGDLVCNQSLFTLFVIPAAFPPPFAAPITHQNLFTCKEFASLSEKTNAEGLSDKCITDEQEGNPAWLSEKGRTGAGLDDKKK